MTDYQAWFRTATAAQEPYPYQQRLAHEPWPDLLDMPTGLGLEVRLAGERRPAGAHEFARPAHDQRPGSSTGGGYIHAAKKETVNRPEGIDEIQPLC